MLPGLSGPHEYKICLWPQMSEALLQTEVIAPEVQANGRVSTSLRLRFDCDALVIVKLSRDLQL